MICHNDIGQYPANYSVAHEVENLIENVTIRLDRLLPAYFERYRIVQPRLPRLPKYELSVIVELTVKNSVTVTINTCKDSPRVIGAVTTPL